MRVKETTEPRWGVHRRGGACRPGGMRTKSPAPLLPLTGLFLCSMAALPAAALRVLPAFAPDAFHYSLDASEEGVVVGHATDFETMTPLLWGKSGPGSSAPVALPLPLGGQGGEARWISPDATLIAGYADVPHPEGLDQAPVLWSRLSSGGYAVASLPRLGAAPAEAVVTGGSANGSRLVGYDGLFETAAVWRGSPSAGYSVQPLALPGSSDGPSFATDVSKNGARIVGRYTTSTTTQAVVWTETSGVYVARDLQTLAGGSESFAETLSADGATAAGGSTSTVGFRPVKWDAATGQVTELQTLPGYEATVLAIAENNAWFGGRSTDFTGLDGETIAVLWNANGEIFDLVSLAAQGGVAFAGFTPESVTGIHFVSNGLYTIVGTGVALDTNLTQGFVLENLALTTPAPIPDPDTDPDPVVVVPSTPTGMFLGRHRQPAAEPESVYLSREESGAGQRPGSGSPRRNR